jgi:hypothetical protein
LATELGYGEALTSIDNTLEDQATQLEPDASDMAAEGVMSS